jgi:hypothetical protein
MSAADKKAPGGNRGRDHNTIGKHSRIPAAEFVATRHNLARMFWSLRRLRRAMGVRP